MQSVEIGKLTDASPMQFDTSSIPNGGQMIEEIYNNLHLIRGI